MIKIAFAILIAMTVTAHASPCERLRKAITVFDVNATIVDSDVVLWNKIIRASKKVCPRK